jgi:hypothetical protein
MYYVIHCGKMLEIDGVIGENEKKFFVLEELLKAEKDIRLTHKQATSREQTHTQHESQVAGEIRLSVDR